MFFIIGFTTFNFLKNITFSQRKNIRCFFLDFSFCNFSFLEYFIYCFSFYIHPIPLWKRFKKLVASVCIFFMCVDFITFFVSLIMYDNYTINNKIFEVSFNFFAFDNVYQNMALALFVSISVLFFASQTFDYQNKPLNMQSSYKQIYFSFILAVGIYIFSTNKSNDLLIYSFAPLSILGANMFEKFEDSIYKEISLYLLFAVGLFFFFAQL